MFKLNTELILVLICVSIGIVAVGDLAKKCFTGENDCVTNDECCTKKCMDNHLCQKCKGRLQSCKEAIECCSKKCEFRGCGFSELNETCTSDDDCQSVKCSGGICTCTPFDHVCKRDIECCDGLFCIDGVCERCRRNDGGCETNDHCCNQNCQNLKCQCQQLKDECSLVKACCIGLLCLNGKCSNCLQENQTCIGNLSCCSNHQCLDGICRKAKALTEVCQVDSECKFADPKNECKNNTCLISRGNPCKSSILCANSYCSMNVCSCVPDSTHNCSSDEDCCGGLICKIGIQCCVLPGGGCEGNKTCCNEKCLSEKICDLNYYKETCTKNNECFSFNCKNGLCQCSIKNQNCRNPSDCCGNTAICSKNICS